MKDKDIIKARPTNRDNSDIIRSIGSLELKRFILPTNIVLNKSTKAIRSYELHLPKKDDLKFSLMDKDVVVEELKLLREDLLVLCKRDIMLNKLSLENVRISDNKIYMYGYDDVSICTDASYTKQYNNIKMNELFGAKILEKENADIGIIDGAGRFYGKFLESEYETVEEFIEKKVKEKNLRLYLTK